MQFFARRVEIVDAADIVEDLRHKRI
jgi:hypothetical protein